MTNDDFDYSEYNNETLQNAIKRCEDDIRDIESRCRGYVKKIRNPRGYSALKLDYFSTYITHSITMLKHIEQEITECQQELGKRGE
jgi:glutaredoxin 2